MAYIGGTTELTYRAEPVQATVAAISRFGLSIPVVVYSIYVVVNLFYQETAGSANYASLAAGGIAIITLFFPSLSGLCFLVLANGASIALALPLQSNHLLMNLFLCVGFVGAYGSIAIRQRVLFPTATELYQAFAPLGRWMLILMYFYGVFHKLNTAFIDPSVSCAVVLWKAYDFPLGLATWPFAHYAAIYGTLAVETTAMLCLLHRRLRYFGIIVGVAFHWFIGFNPYQDYIAFSLLAILLHSMFLPADTGERLANHRWGRTGIALLSSPLRRALVVASGLILLLPVGRQFAWLLFGVAALGFMFVFARENVDGAPDRLGLRPRLPIIALLALLFFVNGALPYLGVKTGQTLSMFSNLTTENGQSNHLIVRHTLSLLPQAALVTIVSTQDPGLKKMTAENDRVTQWTVLNRFARFHLPTTYALNGHLVRLDPTDPASNSGIAPLILRDFLTFKPVNMSRPRPCDNW